LPLAFERIAQRLAKLRPIAHALHFHHDAHQSFPPAKQNEKWFDAVGRPLLSWRVHLLPHLEQRELYERFHFDEPWDSEHNKSLLADMPDVYKTTDDPTTTTFLTVVGKGTAYEGKAGFSMIKDFPDGTSNTLYVVDAGRDKAVPWTKPDDLPFDAEDPIRAFGTSDFGDVFLAALTDGSTTVIPYDTAPEQLRNLFLRADGNTLDLSKKRSTPRSLPETIKITLDRKFQGHQRTVTSVAFSPDGKLIASASGFPFGDNTARLWNRNTGEQLHVLEDHSVPVLLAAFSPDGSRLLTGDVNGRFILWDPLLGKNLKAWIWKTEAPITQVVFSPDGEKVYFAEPGAQPAIRVADAATGKPLNRFSMEINVMPNIALTSDGLQIAASLEDGRVQLLDTNSGKTIRTYAAPKVEGDETKAALVTAISPDGSKLAAGYKASTVRVWDLKTGQVLHDIPTESFFTRKIAFLPGGRLNFITGNLAFLSDSRRLLSCSSVTKSHPESPVACLLDTETGKVLAQSPAI
jgi:WD40 repeat protein